MHLKHPIALSPPHLLIRNIYRSWPLLHLKPPFALSPLHLLIRNIYRSWHLLHLNPLSAHSLYFLPLLMHLKPMPLLLLIRKITCTNFQTFPNGMTLLSIWICNVDCILSLLDLYRFVNNICKIVDFFC